MPMSTDAQRTVRQGDTIEWTVESGNHKVRFNANGATSLAEINTMLGDFDPALIPQPGGAMDSRSGTSGTLLTAKVKEDAATVGKTFIFTCGIHRTDMLSLPFTIAAKEAKEPARTFKLKGVETIDGDNHWHLETAGGDVQVDT